MGENVVITGMGLVTSLGEGTQQNWEQLKQIPSALRGNEEGFSQAKKLTQCAALEALCEARLWDGRTLQDVAPERMGCTLSASKPLFDNETIVPPDAINDFVAERFGLSGERRNVIAACATGAYSIALGASWIEQGLCDVVLAGSVEPAPHPLIAAGFRQMGVLSPDHATRPFDAHRSGFAIGEGAGAVVLESGNHARARGCAPLARLSGWGLGADAHSAIAFNSNGRRIADIIDVALRRAHLEPRQILHVNAHGTATRLNDWIETQALIKAFGTHADHLMISATKASTGHLLGASGSVEFIFTVLALQNQFIPPTATLEEPDPECPLDYTPRQGHGARFDHAMSLSFGFGGPIGTLVVSAC